MIALKIKNLYSPMGVANANQFGKRLGLAPGVAARYWNGTVTAVDLSILDKICSDLDVYAGDVIEFYLPRAKVKAS